MGNNDQDFGWEDISRPEATTNGVRGSMGANTDSFSTGNFGFDAAEASSSEIVTSAVLNHFFHQAAVGSAGVWPKFLASARRFFNVTHGYVLRKALWQLIPVPGPKKKAGSEGEIGQDHDWTTRIHEGLQLDIEEPDLYIPSMGFVTFVLLCGLIRGIHDQFHPDVIASTVTFVMVFLLIETAVVKAALFTAGAVNTPIVDLCALLGYKYFYMSFHITFGLLLGGGTRPTGFLFYLVALALAVGNGVALWQSLRRLARMQPLCGQQECMTEMHKMLLKGLPVMQALVCWMLLPAWPQSAQAVVGTAIASSTELGLASAAQAGLADAALGPPH